MSLWTWAAGAYSEPETAEACLMLQDRFGQNVCLLLWAAWASRMGPLDADTVEAACDTARAWDTVAIEPIRAVRKTLKKPVPDIDDAARLALRERVKAVELAAERSLLEALETLTPPPGSAPRSAPGDRLAALVAVARVWGETTPRSQLSDLAQRLPA